jgi:hypothetical protein
VADRPLTEEQIAELAASLRWLLHAVRAGEMTASAGMTHRLEGAVTALETTIGVIDSDDVDARRL